eukprot:4807070-Prymnesium_polylepis.2
MRSVGSCNSPKPITRSRGGKTRDPVCSQTGFRVNLDDLHLVEQPLMLPGRRLGQDGERERAGL